MNFSETLNYLDDEGDQDASFMLEQFHNISFNSLHAVEEGYDERLRNSKGKITAGHSFNIFTEMWRSIHFEISLIDLNVARYSNGDQTQSRRKHSSNYSENSAPFSIEGLTCELPKLVKLDEYSEMVSLSSSECDMGFKQLKKDIERDKILINGRLVIGSNGGINTLLKSYFQTLDELFLEHQHSYQKNTNGIMAIQRPDFNNTFSKTALHDFGISCFKLASRTNSGGTSFHVLQSFLDTTGFTLVPISTLATPLVLIFSIVPTMASSGIVSISIECSIDCSTVFQLIPCYELPISDSKPTAVSVSYKSTSILNASENEVSSCDITQSDTAVLIEKYNLH